MRKLRKPNQSIQSFSFNSFACTLPTLYTSKPYRLCIQVKRRRGAGGGGGGGGAGEHFSKKTCSGYSLETPR